MRVITPSHPIAGSVPAPAPLSRLAEGLGAVRLALSPAPKVTITLDQPDCAFAPGDRIEGLITLLSERPSYAQAVLDDVLA